MIIIGKLTGSQEGKSYCAVFETNNNKEPLLEFSLFFQQTGLTVIIVPFEWTDFLISRLSDCGVNVASMADITLKKSVQVITRHKAIELIPALMKQAVNHTLKRLVFYDAHALISDETSRSQTSRLLTLNVQSIFLSAALPPYFIPSIESLAQKELPVIRGYSTVRENIEYCVFDCKFKMSAYIFLRWLAEEFIENLATDPNAVMQILVPEMRVWQIILLFLPPGIWPVSFCGGEYQSKKISKGLGDGSYNAIICDPSHSLAYPNISLIIHWHNIISLLESAQATGRAARTGQPAKSIYLKFGDDKKNSEDPDYRAAVEYGVRNQCRRVTMTEYMDGRPLSCFMRQGYAKCDFCQLNSSPFRQRVNAHPDNLFQTDYRFCILRRVIESTPSYYCLRNDIYSNEETPCDKAGQYFDCHIRKLLRPGHCYTCGMKEVSETGIRRHDTLEGISCKYSHAMQEALMYCYMAYRSESLTELELPTDLVNRIRNANTETDSTCYSGDIHIVRSAFHVLFKTMFRDGHGSRRLSDTFYQWN